MEVRVFSTAFRAVSSRRLAIAVGRYESPSDVVCEALRSISERETDVRRELKRVVVALKALEMA